MLLKRLARLLKSMEGNISISGDTDILTLENIQTTLQNNSIKITGFDEELAEQCFILVADDIKEINTSCGEIELHTIDGNLIILSAY